MVVEVGSEWEKYLGDGVSAIQAVMVVSGPMDVGVGVLIRVSKDGIREGLNLEETKMMD